MEGSALKPKRVCGVENEDRISDLPDSILRHILSFLPTICCVRSSCLSRRWRYIWTSVPALHFRDTYYASLIKPCDTTTCMKSFSNFVNRVLILNKSPCRSFCLYLFDSKRYSTFDVDSWIWAAIIRNVENLYFCTFSKVKLPQTLFSCEKLVKLVLGCDIDLNVPTFVNLPSLKILNISYVPGHSLTGDYINRLILGCIALEILTIKRSILDSIETLAILSSSLKRFELCNGYSKDGVYYMRGSKNYYSVIIDAPKLTSLSLTDHNSENNDIELRNITSMSEAVLSFFPCVENLPQICGTDIVQFLKNYSINVLSANVFALLKALFDASCNKLLCCGNMKYLTVTFCGADLKILPDILCSFPNLQVLSLMYMECNHAVRYDDLEKKKSEIYCLNHSLKKVEFIGFKGKEAEVRMAEYFLKNAMVLHEIRFQSKRELEMEVLKKLLKFPRCSGACEIDVVVS